MRIAHVNADGGVRPGAAKGAWVHVRAMREAFADLGREVIALDEPDSERLAARLEEAAPLDLIYERFSLRADRAWRFAVARGLPYVLEVNAPLDEEEARHRPGRRPPMAPELLRSQLRAATTVLCVSREVAGWAVSRGAHPERVLTVGNAVDPRRFHPSRRDAGVRERLGIEDSFVLGFHGRLRPWHGFEALARVAAELLRQGVPTHVLTVGRGEYAGLLERHLGREHWTAIDWVDHDEVGDWVAAFDALALTYSPDQPCYFSPLKLLEAMAAGVAVLVPDLGDLPLAVESGEAGVIYPAGDWETLAARLADLARNADVRRTLASAGRVRAEGFTWTAIAARLLERVLEGVP